MNKQIALVLCCLLSATAVFSQQLTQTVRGTVLDVDSKSPLIGAVVVVSGSNPTVAAVTDVNGNFRLENIPTGRITLELSYLGYEPKVVPNVVVNSGKEVVLNLNMQESFVKLDAAVVEATSKKGEAINDMAILSARSISAEETNRYAGGFNDPSRIMANFAGVSSTGDGSNDIIVRGNSPKYIQWRLEGTQITNPNHFADQNAVSGAVSTLNNNLLATSDFYTGAFSAEYGDVLAGVYDVKLRAGNNEKFESVFGFGLLGTDLTLEGPLKKGYAGSYLLNYRYSTATLIKDIGLIDDVGGVPKFQDAAFKVMLPTERFGSFSVFGLGGISSFLLEDVTPEIWDTPGHRFMEASISEDYKKSAHLLNTGLNHTISLNEKSFLKTTLSFSSEGMEDDVFEEHTVKVYDDEGRFLRDSVGLRQLNFNSRLEKTTYRGAVKYSNKLNARQKLQIGTNYSLFDYRYGQSRLNDQTNSRETLVDFNEQVGTVRNFVSWKYRITEALTMVAGVHNMNVLFNNKSTIEPRLAFNWRLNSRNAIHAGYGKHSTMESIHNYFAKVPQSDGSLSEPNHNLDLLKAHHYVLGYEHRFNSKLMAKMEVYYQELYDLPVENNDTSYYATINEGLEFRYVDLVNEGTGENYGVELTVERFFNNNYYYLINGSLFSSKYKALDGVERNTQYNGNYIVNLLAGKEFVGWGKKQNQTFGLNAKVFFGGGKKIIPLLRDNSGQLAVDPEQNRFYDYEKAYEDKIEDIYTVTISFSYKWNRSKTTHEVFMNLDNITNNQGKLSEFYDESEPNSIGYVKQFGFFPNLMYRVYF